MCYCVKFAVVGAASYFVSVGVAGEARVTVVMDVVLPANEKITGRPKGDTVKRLKAKKPTVKPKTAAAML